MTRAARSIVVLMLACALSPALPAASLRPLSFAELVGSSDEIVVGKVVSKESRWQGKLIVTVARVEVRESLKGRPGGSIEVTELGGTATHPTTGLEVRMDASTHVTLEPGEDVLLFVSRGQDGVGRLVGAQQGRMTIRTDPQTGEREIPLGPKRLEVLRGPGGDSVEGSRMTLDEMRERIRHQIDLDPAAGSRREGRRP